MNEHDNHKPGQRIVAVDFDGTLASYDGFKGVDHLGDPIPEMVEKVKAALAVGDEVFIFTARISPSDESFEEGINAAKSFLNLAQWLQEHLGVLLPITNVKSRRWTELWDDRGVQVLPNTGLFLQELIDATDGAGNTATSEGTDQEAYAGAEDRG